MNHYEILNIILLAFETFYWAEVVGFIKMNIHWHKDIAKIIKKIDKFDSLLKLVSNFML